MKFSPLAITALSATISSFMVSAHAAAAPRNRNRKVAKKHGGSSNGLSGADDCWITIKGPPTAPSASPPCLQVDVANINGVMTWSKSNAYLLSFRNLPDGTCAVVVNNGFTPGPIPGGLVSPNGKFYLGPYSVAGVGQAFAVYDKAPTIDGYTEPIGATSHVTTKDAPLDPTSVAFDYSSSLWTLNGPKPPFTTVQDAISRETKKLLYSNTYCMSDPGGYEGVALSVTFYDGAMASVQRAQGVSQWSVVDQSCDDFNYAKAHMDGMCTASCNQITSEQYGADLVTGQTWQ